MECPGKGCFGIPERERGVGIGEQLGEAHPSRLRGRPPGQLLGFVVQEIDGAVRVELNDQRVGGIDQRFRVFLGVAELV